MSPNAEPRITVCEMAAMLRVLLAHNPSFTVVYETNVLRVTTGDDVFRIVVERASNATPMRQNH